MTPGKPDEPRPSRADVISALTGRVVLCPKHPRLPAKPIEYAEELGWVCDRCGPVVVARARLPVE